MKEIIFRIENRYLLKNGWQRCIAAALDAQGIQPVDIPQGARLAHRPIPNKAQTIFFIFCVPEGKPDPVMQTGKVRDFYEFMSHERNNPDHPDIQSKYDVAEAARCREELLTKLQSESDSRGRPFSDPGGISIH